MLDMFTTFRGTPRAILLCLESRVSQHNGTPGTDKLRTPGDCSLPLDYSLPLKRIHVVIS